MAQRLEREAEGGGSEWGEGQAEDVGGRTETENGREKLRTEMLDPLSGSL